MRGVVYVLVLLVVIGMILAVVGPALATAAPAAPESEATQASQQASQPASDAASSSRSSSRPAPVVVLATNNLTWADLQEQASREGAGESSGSSGVGSAADRLLAFAQRGEPMNLSVRTPADRTCPADAWLTLGRGKRASAIEASASCAGPTATIPRSTPLVEALGQDISIQAVGPGTQLATGAPGGSATRPAPVAPSVADALAADADLTIIDTASAASTDAERIAALDEALRTVQEQSRPGTRIVVASLAAIAGGVGGVSSNTSYVESAAGVGEGARTGLASVVTGCMFALSMFFAPLVKMVPYEAATPALVVVGFLMMMQVTDIDWKSPEIALPAFLTIIMMPFSYSITNGIGAGFVSYLVIEVAQGRARKIHPLMWVACAMFVVYFTLAPIKAILGVS